MKSVRWVALVAVALTGPISAAFVYLNPPEPQGVQRVVTVDVARIFESQRRTLLSDPREGHLRITRAGKLVEEEIRRAAGPQAVVLVKQAVVATADPLDDITDDVLVALGLPTDVQTAFEIRMESQHRTTPQGVMLDAFDDVIESEIEERRNPNLERLLPP